MYKKALILVSVILFALCIFSSYVFATDNVKNAISNVTDTVVDGAARLGNDVRSGVGTVENGIENTFNMNNDNNKADTGTTTTDNTGIVTTDDYVATRTTADATTTNNTSTLWIWLIVAIAAIVIIGLVWYYGTQNNVHHSK